MTHCQDARRICPLCRAFPRFKLQVAHLGEGSDHIGEQEKLFTTGCWIVAALERTNPCAAHRETLSEARGLAEELARLVEKEGEGRWTQE